MLEAEPVMVIGIDGLSAAAFERAKLPHLRALADRGAYTMKARGVLPTVSSPNWGSVLMGAGPEQHGITSNDWQRDKYEIEPLWAAAIQYWKQKRPDLLFVHLDDVDHAGHEHGWESQTYFEEADRVDGLVGQLLQVGEGALVIVVSDHGGTGKKHGNANNNDLLVPLVIAGPGVKRGKLGEGVNLYDVAPTVTAAFGVRPHACWIGKARGR